MLIIKNGELHRKFEVNGIPQVNLFDRKVI